MAQILIFLDVSRVEKLNENSFEPRKIYNSIVKLIRSKKFELKTNF